MLIEVRIVSVSLFLSLSLSPTLFPLPLSPTVIVVNYIPDDLNNLTYITQRHTLSFTFKWPQGLPVTCSHPACSPAKSLYSHILVSSQAPDTQSVLATAPLHCCPPVWSLPPSGWLLLSVFSCCHFFFLLEGTQSPSTFYLLPSSQSLHCLPFIWSYNLHLVGVSLYINLVVSDFLMRM